MKNLRISFFTCKNDQIFIFWCKIFAKQNCSIHLFLISFSIVCLPMRVTRTCEFSLTLSFPAIFSNYTANTKLVAIIGIQTIAWKRCMKNLYDSICSRVQIPEIISAEQRWLRTNLFWLSSDINTCGWEYQNMIT